MDTNKYQFGGGVESNQKMRAYIAGPMSGITMKNFPAFERAALALRKMGHEIVSPHEINTSDGLAWEEYMKRDIAQLVTCDTIITLDGWESSRGANVEVNLGRILRMKILHISEVE